MNRHIAALLGALLLATPAAAQGGGVVRVGIIGLDTSHSLAFTQLLNAPEPAADLAGFRVVAAYPYGSRTIESSVSRRPG